MCNCSGWFSDICERDSDGFSDPTDLGLSKSVIPKLLRLSWMGYPLHRHKNEKWGFIVPKTNSEFESEMNMDCLGSGNFPLRTLSTHLESKGVSDREHFDDLEIVREPPDRSGDNLEDFLILNCETSDKSC